MTVRNHELRIRLTKHEREEIKRQARHAGQSLSEYARQALLSPLLDVQRKMQFDLSLLRQWIGECRQQQRK